MSFFLGKMHDDGDGSSTFLVGFKQKLVDKERPRCLYDPIREGYWQNDSLWNVLAANVGRS